MTMPGNDETFLVFFNSDEHNCMECGEKFTPNSQEDMPVLFDVDNDDGSSGVAVFHLRCLSPELRAEAERVQQDFLKRANARWN
jgi:hypothetical protein